MRILTIALAALMASTVASAQEARKFNQPVEVHVGRIFLGTGVSMVFEGATNDAFETTLTAADVGADVTITLPGGGDAAFAFFPTTLTTNDVSVVNSVWGASNALVFEGATADAYETSIVPTDATADRTLTLPNATDTLVGKATTDTFTNKSISLTTNTLTGTSAELLTAISDETGTGLAVFGTTPTLTTPVLGVATGTSFAATGLITSSSPSAGIGYATGAGCAVTQGSGSGRATGVTCTGMSGAITTDTTSLAAEGSADFIVTNTSVAIGDVIVLSIRSGEDSGGTLISVQDVTAGTFAIRVHNGNVASGTAETGAIVINFAAIKAVGA